MSTDNMQSDNTDDVSTSHANTANAPTEQNTTRYTMSLTKANKILNKLKSAAKDDKAPGHSRMYGATRKPIGVTTNMVHFDEADIRKRLADITEFNNNKILTKYLTEKWKNALFTYNIRHKINEILSEMEYLKYEKKILADILTDFKSQQYISLNDAEEKMKKLTDYAGKYEVSWAITDYSADQLTERIASIDKRLLELDTRKDFLNATKVFTIDLTEAERKLVGL